MKLNTCPRLFIKYLIILFVLVWDGSNSVNVSLCDGIDNVNRPKSDLYSDQNENQKTKLHILHIACKDLRTNANIDAEATTDFAAELVNNDASMLSGYKVVVHTRFVDGVGSLSICLIINVFFGMMLNWMIHTLNKASTL